MRNIGITLLVFLLAAPLAFAQTGPCGPDGCVENPVDGGGGSGSGSGNCGFCATIYNANGTPSNYVRCEFGEFYFQWSNCLQSSHYLCFGGMTECDPQNVQVGPGWCQMSGIGCYAGIRSGASWMYYDTMAAALVQFLVRYGVTPDEMRQLAATAPFAAKEHYEFYRAATEHHTGVSMRDGAVFVFPQPAVPKTRPANVAVLR